VNSLHGILNCEIGGLDCRIITTEYRTRVLCIHIYNLFYNALVHVTYSVVSGQYSYTICSNNGKSFKRQFQPYQILKIDLQGFRNRNKARTCYYMYHMLYTTGKTAHKIPSQCIRSVHTVLMVQSTTSEFGSWRVFGSKLNWATIWLPFFNNLCFLPEI